MTGGNGEITGRERLSGLAYLPSLEGVGGMGAGNLNGVINGFIAIVSGVAVGGCILVVMVRGLQWMAGRREEAKLGLQCAFWGLTIIVTAKWLVNLAYSVASSVVQ